MLPYCLKCRKSTESVNQRISGTHNGKTMILSEWTICGATKSRYIKK